MSSAVIQLLVLAGVAIFLIVKLRSVLGTRDGFEKPPLPGTVPTLARKDGRPPLEVIEGGVDTDILDHAKEGSTAARALAAMKLREPAFGAGDFLRGARGAYEMILMAFERGNIEDVRAFLAPEVAKSFEGVIANRESEGLKVEATFVGLRDIALSDAEFDHDTGEAEITVRFVGELTSVVRDRNGAIIEGNVNEIRRQKDVWTFARRMGINDPNWQLVATGD